MGDRGNNKKVTNSLLALSSAAVLAVYAAGYQRTKAAADKFTADPKSPADCGHSCHSAVKAKDYICHPYQKR